MLLFYSYTLRVKLIDFGGAFLCKEQKSDFGGTSIFMAPEVIFHYIKISMKKPAPKKGHDLARSHLIHAVMINHPT